MTEAQAIEAIEALFATEWTALDPAVPFTLVNEQFTAAAKWVAVDVKHDSRVQSSQGQAPYRKFECRGTIVVTLYAPVDEGRRTLAQLADDVRVVLEGRNIATGGEVVITHGGATAELPTDGAWAKSTVTVAFLYYQTR